MSKIENLKKQIQQIQEKIDLLENQKLSLERKVRNKIEYDSKIGNKQENETKNPSSEISEESQEESNSPGTMSLFS